MVKHNSYLLLAANIPRKSPFWQDGLSPVEHDEAALAEKVKKVRIITLL